MAKKFVIAEAPVKAETLARYLGRAGTVRRCVREDCGYSEATDQGLLVQEEVAG